MKFIMLIIATLFLVSCGNNQNPVTQTVSSSMNQDSPQADFSSDETDEAVLTPEQELEYFSSLEVFGKALTYRFAQTTWNECSDWVTGNYYGYNCVRSRGISVILKKFIDAHMYKCVNRGLAAQGGGTVSEFHIVHAGIFGDPRHSPRSLHAENRAIDIKSLEVLLTNGTTRNIVYAGAQNREFFKAFRSCWGDIVRTYNGCPTYNGVLMYTGSIGWEDSNHQRHLHTSVPYCLSNKTYGPYYYRR